MNRIIEYFLIFVERLTTPKQWPKIINEDGMKSKTFLRHQDLCAFVNSEGCDIIAITQCGEGSSYTKYTLFYKSAETSIPENN